MRGPKVPTFNPVWLKMLANVFKPSGFWSASEDLEMHFVIVAEIRVCLQVVKGVYDGVHEVALKVSETEIARETIMKEISILKNCRHSNIVQV